MSFSLINGKIVQQGTDTSLSGIESIPGVSVLIPADVRYRKVYTVTDIPLDIQGSLTIDALKERIIIAAASTPSDPFVNVTGSLTFKNEVTDGQNISYLGMPEVLTLSGPGSSSVVGIKVTSGGAIAGNGVRIHANYKTVFDGDVILNNVQITSEPATTIEFNKSNASLNNVSVLGGNIVLADGITAEGLSCGGQVSLAEADLYEGRTANIKFNGPASSSGVSLTNNAAVNTATIELTPGVSEDNKTVVQWYSSLNLSLVSPSDMSSAIVFCQDDDSGYRVDYRTLVPAWNSDNNFDFTSTRFYMWSADASGALNTPFHTYLNSDRFRLLTRVDGALNGDSSLLSLDSRFGLNKLADIFVKGYGLVPSRRLVDLTRPTTASMEVDIDQKASLSVAQVEALQEVSNTDELYCAVVRWGSLPIQLNLSTPTKDAYPVKTVDLALDFGELHLYFDPNASELVEYSSQTGTLIIRSSGLSVGPSGYNKVKTAGSVSGLVPIEGVAISSGGGSGGVLTLKGLSDCLVTIVDSTGQVEASGTHGSGVFQYIPRVAPPSEWFAIIKKEGFHPEIISFDPTLRLTDTIELMRIKNLDDSASYGATDSPDISVVFDLGGDCRIQIGGVVTAQEVFDKCQRLYATTLGSSWLAEGNEEVVLVKVPTGDYLYLPEHTKLYGTTSTAAIKGAVSSNTLVIDPSSPFPIDLQAPEVSPSLADITAYIDTYSIKVQDIKNNASLIPALL